MIVYKTGDIFTEEVEAIVNTVNCVGVMGRGIALQFKKRFPENFKAYETACKQNKVVPGKMFVYETGSLIYPKYIINFPTKRHWRGASRMEDIEAGLEDLAEVITKLNIKSIALPPLGAGLGGLDWNDVRARIENMLSNLSDVEIIVFEPKGAPEAKKMVKNRKVPKMTPGRAALIELIHRYLSGLLDPFVSLLEVHKLMYFLQESGEPLRLKYQKNIYGPYAENLRHVLNAVEGHMLSGYADGGDRPDKELRLVPGAYEDATEFMRQHPQTRQHFEKVSELVEGFESPFGMELLATVHWVAAKEGASSKDQVIEKVHQWNVRKKQFSPRQIELAYTVLIEKGWLLEERNNG
ncbi:type II toxin-antitoxin system antitoxin DNA ADP-ribosyl glycohydrolase DarG [methane-oxidizing endosymbiont of Gigantopelta aegis]|uniref:type II toxin-antitoxin system antitoxin DNA ADP-ribosyl glycohydrolase DarG n=1 Tax=methane-oxidizing endosymbiont of Gigantopelta aegis TaxID=2794938 RepID=UPI0018DBA28D|nr:macro domain-containing protein [methane-oxidizing endosymbiont of Gigantopelta aegis]